MTSTDTTTSVLCSIPAIGRLLILFSPLCVVAVFAFCKWYRSQSKENVYFLGFIILLFSVLYSVTVLELNISSVGIGKQEANKLRDDVSAKTSSVKKMAEDIARLQVFTITNMNKYERAEARKEKLEANKRIEEFLNEIGSEKKTIDQITTHLYKDIANYLVNECVDASLVAPGVSNKDKSELRLDLYKRMNRHIEENSLEDYVIYLQANDLYSESVRECISKLKFFLEKKQLK